MSAYYNVRVSIESQKKLCETKKLPLFAPYDGVCWNCHKNIYEPFKQSRDNDGVSITGITTAQAGTELVTGCPHCCRTYCD